MNEFFKMSKYAGMREDLVQAGGGNSSYKVSPTEMVIKSSGYQLADLKLNEGYAVVNPQIIRNAFLNAASIDGLTEKHGSDILRRAFIEGNKPSIETFLHAVSGTYTLHTHPVVVNAMTCRKDGMSTLKKIFPEALIIPYRKPGTELAKVYFKTYQEKVSDEKQIFDIVFMQNHGLVVSGETAEAVMEKTEQVVCKIEAFLKCDCSAYRMATELWKCFPDKIVWRVTDKNVLEAYRKNGLWSHQFCPDCIVFLGKQMLKLDGGNLAQQIEAHEKKYGEPVVVAKGQDLYIVAASVKKALEIQSVLSFSAQVMDINVGYECHLLSESEQNELLNWDAEKYRQNMK